MVSQARRSYERHHSLTSTLSLTRDIFEQESVKQSQMKIVGGHEELSAQQLLSEIKVAKVTPKLKEACKIVTFHTFFVYILPRKNTFCYNSISVSFIKM